MVLTNRRIKLHIIFLLISILIIAGAIVDSTKSNPGIPSAYNNIAFMLIFLFTLYQYFQLKSHICMKDETDIKGLKSLMTIEVILVLLNVLLIGLYFNGTHHSLQSLRLSITLIKYLKIYMLLSLYASLKVSVEDVHHS